MFNLSYEGRVLKVRTSCAHEVCVPRLRIFDNSEIFCALRSASSAIQRDACPDDGRTGKKAGAAGISIKGTIDKDSGKGENAQQARGAGRT